MNNYYFFDKNKKGTMLSTAEKSGLAYSMAAILPAIFSLVFVIVLSAVGITKEAQGQDWYLYLSFLLPQIASAVLIFWFVKFTKTPLLQATGVKKTHWKYFLLAVALQIGLLSLSEVNVWFIELLSEAGYAGGDIVLPSLDGFGFVGVLLVVGILPALLEEGVFRGILLNGLKGFGTLGCCLLCGGLFALYHQNPSQTIYQFCCGCAFALVAVRSGSALPTMLSHFINNALILVLTKLGVETFPVWFFVISAVCLVGSLIYLIFLDEKKTDEPQPQEEKKSVIAKQFFLCASVGIFIYSVTWVASLFV